MLWACVPGYYLLVILGCCDYALLFFSLFLVFFACLWCFRIWSSWNTSLHHLTQTYHSLWCFPYYFLPQLIHIWIFLITLDIPYLCLRRYSFLLRFSFPFLASDIFCRLYFLMICSNHFSEMLLFWKVIWFERLDINSFSLLVGFLQTFFTFAFIVR